MTIRAFQRLSQTGRIVSGFGAVEVDGREVLAQALEPQWLTATTIAAKRFGRDAEGRDIDQHLWAVETDGTNPRSLVAGPVPVFAAGAGRVFVPAPGEYFPAIDPVTGALGVIVEQNNDNNARELKIDGRLVAGPAPLLELRMAAGIAVWAEFTHRSPFDTAIRGCIGDGPVLDLRTLADDFERTPVPFIVDGVAWFAFITNVDIRLRPMHAFAGYIIETGENKNKNLDAVGLPGGRFARLTWDGDARDIDLFLERVDTRRPLAAPPIIVVPPPVNPPNPPNPETPPVSTPNRLDIATRVAAEHQTLVTRNTTASCGELTEWIALALHAADAGWGLLSKNPGEEQYRGHAVDAVIYQPTQQVIDLIAGAGAREAGEDRDAVMVWQEQPKRPTNNWMAPIQPEGSTPVPPPTPPPSGELAARVAVLEGDLADVVALNLLQTEQIEELQGKVRDLEQRPAPEFTLPELVAEGSTGRTLGHGHSVRLNVRRA